MNFTGMEKQMDSSTILFSDNVVSLVQEGDQNNLDKEQWFVTYGPVTYVVSRNPLPEDTPHVFEGHIMSNNKPVFVYLAMQTK